MSGGAHAPAGDERGWQDCDDPRFALRFCYPAQAPDGAPIARVEEHGDDALTLRIHSSDRTTVYFEVSWFGAAEALARYQDLRARNAHPQAELRVGALRAAVLAGQPGHRFALRRGALVRRVYLVQRGPGFYRITFDPTGALNRRILATLTFR